jgi:hypothetical protein
VTVRLPNGSGGGYHQPQTSDGNIVFRTNAAGGYPTDFTARARFIARHRGTADLTAYTDYSCLHQQPQCEIAQRDWIVHVVVH